jgi:hypothetical protein
VTSVIIGAASQTHPESLHVSRLFRFLLSCLIALSCVGLHAATYVVPPDEAMIGRADVIVIARALHSHAQRSDGSIETVTVFAVEDVLKGDATLADGLRVHSPGGMIEGKAHEVEVEIVPGAPSFVDGVRVLLFLKKTPDGDYATADLGLGLFGFATDDLGHRVIVRTASEITGWNPDGSTYEEPHRDAGRFLGFIRDIVNRRPAIKDYTIQSSPLVGENHVSGTSRLQPRALSAFTVVQYTLASSAANENSTGSRWTTFPGPVSWNRGNTGINVTNGGNDLINAAFAAWNGEVSSNVNFVLSTFDANLNGIRQPFDGVNNIVFEKDGTAFGVAAFSCSQGGVLGTGGIHRAINNPANIVNGELFFQISETDVSMNQGVGACLPGGANTLSMGNLQTAVTHEFGHCLSFRHSDQSRTLTQLCTSQANYDCTTAALMNHILLSGDNGVLTAWDIRAVEALYPAPAAPANVIATVAPTGNVSLTWTAVNGAMSYTVYRTANNANYANVGAPVTNDFTDSSAAPNTAYLYKVTATISGVESPFSNKDLATTVVFTDSVLALQSTSVKAVHITGLRTAVDAVRKLANGGNANAFNYTDPAVTPQSTVVKRIHVIDLRNALDPARAALGLPALSYADQTITQQTTRVKASHFAELRNGVL